MNLLHAGALGNRECALKKQTLKFKNVLAFE